MKENSGRVLTGQTAEYRREQKYVDLSTCLSEVIDNQAWSIIGCVVLITSRCVRISCAWGKWEK